MPNDYDAELSKINSDEEKFKEIIASRRVSLINEMLEALGLLRDTPYDHALCMIHRNISIWKKLQADSNSEELKELRAKAKAYDTMFAAPAVFVDPEVFMQATNTYFNDDSDAVSLMASNNRVFPEEIKLVEFVSYVSLLDDKE